MKKLLLGALVVAALAACGMSGETEKVEVAKPMTMEEIVAAASAATTNAPKSNFFILLTSTFK